MALNLDLRQRAMLQEMGITVWQPEPLQESVEFPAEPAAAAPQPRQSEPRQPQPAPRPAPAMPSPSRPQPVAAVQPSEGAAALGWRLHPARPVYAPAAGAPAAGVPAAGAPAAGGAATADGGWLILLEHPTAQGVSAPASAAAATGTALEGDAARLLDNMLRALRLHQHPRVWSAALERDGAQASAAAGDCPALGPGLETMVRELQPARILVLGLAAARAVLGRSDALGRLRAEPHRVAGRPAVVTYDPGYLLRAAHAKPAAWADLCRAQSLGQTITPR